MSDITKDQFWNALNEPEPVISYRYGYKILTWFDRYDKLHRENDLPAAIWYHKDGSIYRQYWYQNNKRHRIGGPAVIWYDIKGNIEEKCWYQYGKKHRINGPAEIWSIKDGSVFKKDWYLNGKEYTEEDYWQKMKGIEC